MDRRTIPRTDLSLVVHTGDCIELHQLGADDHLLIEHHEFVLLAKTLLEIDLEFKEQFATEKD